MTGAGQGGGAGGVEPVPGAQVLGQLWCGDQRLGIQACGRGVVVLDEAEFRHVQAVGGGGFVRALDDGGTAAFQGQQVTAALPQAFEILAEFRFLRRQEFETAADRGVGFGELPFGQQRLAESPVGRCHLGSSRMACR